MVLLVVLLGVWCLLVFHLKFILAYTKYIHMSRLFLYIGLPVFLVLFLGGCVVGQQTAPMASPAHLRQLKVGDTSLAVEVADTEAAR